MVQGLEEGVPPWTLLQHYLTSAVSELLSIRGRTQNYKFGSWSDRSRFWGNTNVFDFNTISQKQIESDWNLIDLYKTTDYPYFKGKNSQFMFWATNQTKSLRSQTETQKQQDWLMIDCCYSLSPSCAMRIMMSQDE